MSGPNLDYAVRDPAGKVLLAGTLIKPQDAQKWAFDWDARRVPGPVEVDVAPGVDLRAENCFTLNVIVHF